MFWQLYFTLQIFWGSNILRFWKKHNLEFGSGIWKW